MEADKYHARMSLSTGCAPLGAGIQNRQQSRPFSARPEFPLSYPGADEQHASGDRRNHVSCWPTPPVTDIAPRRQLSEGWLPTVAGLARRPAITGRLVVAGAKSQRFIRDRFLRCCFSKSHAIGLADTGPFNHTTACTTSHIAPACFTPKTLPSTGLQPRSARRSIVTLRRP